MSPTHWKDFWVTKEKDRLADSKQTFAVTPTERDIISVSMSYWELDVAALRDLTTLANDHSRVTDLEQIRLLKWARECFTTGLWL